MGLEVLVVAIQVVMAQILFLQQLHQQVAVEEQAQLQLLLEGLAVLVVVWAEEPVLSGLELQAKVMLVVPQGLMAL